MQKIEANKFYKAFDGKTILVCFEEDDIFWAMWHEQALDEPNHGLLAFNEAGEYLVHPKTFTIDSDTSSHIEREVTPAEQKQIDQEIKCKN